MRISCPHCGERGNDEFTVLGDASVVRPDPSSPPEAWTEYVYFRTNPAGVHREFWYHGAGCRAWLVVTRNVVTHEIIGIEMAREAALARHAAASAGAA